MRGWFARATARSWSRTTRRARRSGESAGLIKKANYAEAEERAGDREAEGDGEQSSHEAPSPRPSPEGEGDSVSAGSRRAALQSASAAVAAAHADSGGEPQLAVEFERRGGDALDRLSQRTTCARGRSRWPSLVRRLCTTGCRAARRRAAASKPTTRSASASARLSSRQIHGRRCGASARFGEQHAESPAITSERHDCGESRSPLHKPIAGNSVRSMAGAGELDCRLPQSNVPSADCV